MTVYVVACMETATHSVSILTDTGKLSGAGVTGTESVQLVSVFCVYVSVCGTHGSFV